MKLTSSQKGKLLYVQYFIVTAHDQLGLISSFSPCVKVIFEFQLMAYFEIYVYFVVTVYAISCAPGKREHAYAFGESFLSLRRSQM